MQFITAGNAFEIRTSLDRDAARKALEEKVSKNEGFNLFSSNVFAGRVGEGSFEIEELWGFFRLLNPTFYGSFEGTEAGTVIKVKASGGLARQNSITYWIASGATLIIAASRLYYADYRGTGAFLAFSALSACFAIGMGRIYAERLRAGKLKLISLFEAAERRSLGGNREQLEKKFFKELGEFGG